MIAVLPPDELSRRAMLLLAEQDAAIDRFESHPIGTAKEFDTTLHLMQRDRERLFEMYQREKQKSLGG